MLYAPDYVINGGGIINVANEVHGRVVSAEDGMKNVENIYNTLTEIFKVSDKTGRTTNAIADEMKGTGIGEGNECDRAVVGS